MWGLIQVLGLSWGWRVSWMLGIAGFVRQSRGWMVNRTLGVRIQDCELAESGLDVGSWGFVTLLLGFGFRNLNRWKWLGE